MTRGYVKWPSKERVLRGLKSGLRKAGALEPLELAQVYTRFAVGLVITIYVGLSYLLEHPARERIEALLVLLTCAWLSGFALLFHISFFPERHLERRIASITADAVAMSLLLHFGERSAAIFFPVYLWVTLGNGFRFGISYMTMAMAANGLAFAAMVTATPYWRSQWQFSAGLLIAIVAIPLYVSSLIQKLRSAMVEAKAASTAKTSFLSVMSHELRTPLNAILGLAQLSKAKATTSQEHTSAIWTELAAQRLMRMVDTILNFQRVEVGAANAQLRRLKLLDILYEVQGIVQPLALRKKLKFNIVFTSGIPAEIVSDKDILETIILNLCTNAVKYTKQGTVTLGVGVTRSHSDRDMLRIEVRDTGAGIDPEFQPHVFERFTRGKISEADDEGGVGLGLSLCKSLAEMLQGSIGLKSSLGEGSIFSVDIPVETLPQNGMLGSAGDAQSILFLGCGEAWKPFAAEADNARLAQSVFVSSPDEFLEKVYGRGDLLKSVAVFDPSNLPERSKAILSSVAANGSSAPALVLTVPDSDGAAFWEEWPGASYLSPGESDFRGLLETVSRWHSLNASLAYENRVFVLPQARKLKVLIADDNKLNLEVIRRMLEMDGHSVIEANGGEKALDVLLTAHVDLAVLDINMPDFDGIEITKLYRSTCAKDALIPLVALTADTSEELHAECLEAGMAKVLCKPVTLNALRELLANTTLPAAAPASRNIEIEADAPIVDQDRVQQLTELFGPRGFSEELLPKFETEMDRSLNKLKRAVSQSRLKEIRATLHAIKSSANTIGAARLSQSVIQFEGSNTLDQKAAYSQLKVEVVRYLEVARVPADAN